MRDLCGSALDAAIGAGASYADARAVVRRAQSVNTKNGRVENVSDVESEGVGVRVLVDGAWGSRATDGSRPRARAARCAPPNSRGRQAAAREGARPRARTERRVPDACRGRPVHGLARRQGRALPAREEALHHDDVKVTQAAKALREHKVLATSDGALIEQEVVESGGGIDAIAVGDGGYQVRSHRARTAARPRRRLEYLEELGLEREAPRVGEQAAALLRAEPCPSTVTTVVIDAEQMELQVHESVGHPIELDRVYGSEAAYAGTSFLKPADLGRCATAPRR